MSWKAKPITALNIPTPAAKVEAFIPNIFKIHKISIARRPYLVKLHSKLLIVLIFLASNLAWPFLGSNAFFIADVKILFNKIEIAIISIGYSST